MTANAIVAGVFADLKTVRTRSIVQMVIEIPVEHAAEVIDKFGFPQPGAEVAVAVARLVDTSRSIPWTPSPPADASRVLPEPAAPVKERTPWDAMKYAKQVSVACGDPEFRVWLARTSPVQNYLAELTAAEAVQDVKARILISSRKELDADPEGPAVRRWNELHGEFKRWQRDQVGQQQAEAQAQAYRR